MAHQALPGVGDESLIPEQPRLSDVQGEVQGRSSDIGVALAAVVFEPGMSGEQRSREYHPVADEECQTDPGGEQRGEPHGDPALSLDCRAGHADARWMATVATWQRSLLTGTSARDGAGADPPVILFAGSAFRALRALSTGIRPEAARAPGQTARPIALGVDECIRGMPRHGQPPYA